MDILYVVSNLTGDERAIYRSLQLLGAKVQLIYDIDLTTAEGFDVVLFHHSSCCLEEIKQMDSLKVVWCFDLMSHHDYGRQSFGHRKSMAQRARWIETVLDIVDVGFFTDGGVVDAYPEKAIRLTQGAQETNYSAYREEKYDITFAGTIGPHRERFLQNLQEKISSRINIVTGTSQVFGEDFANLVAASKIMLAPFSPIKLNYWSNRVYMICGYRGFLLHPFIPELSKQYENGREVVFYTSLGDAAAKINHYLEHDEQRDLVAEAGWKRTVKEHTYLHRCKTLMKHLKANLCKV